jgi:6-pyruvoyltetrahydropterin/6-carboxytetrahydropterin synthase
LSPFLCLSLKQSELPMMRLSQKFEFSASHRLHNPQLSDDENCRIFGKCNNPHGHGHNYVLQVTIRGKADENGLLVEIPSFERIVAETVIDRVDHRNLNSEVPEFSELIPSVENIARVIYGWLEPNLRNNRSELASVTVWETSKTWCEYAG